MIILKSFYRKKTTKIYLVILSALLTAFVILISLITYFTNMQNDIYYKSSEIVIVNSENLYAELTKITNLTDINRTLVFEENKNYDIIITQNYTIQDVNGNIIDSFEGSHDSNKLTWVAMERGYLENYILVEPASNYNYELGNEEIIIGVSSSFYDIYISSYDAMINKKIGFIFDDDNLEFKIINVVEADKSILIISDELYEEFINSGTQYAYTAKLSVFKEQTSTKTKLEGLSNNDSHMVYVGTDYINNNSNKISNLYDLLDILTLACYLAIILFLIIVFIVMKNIVNDFKQTILLNRKIGFNKVQIQIDLLKCLLTLYLFAVIFAILIFLLFVLFIYLFFSINLIYINISILLSVLIIEFILIIVIIIIKSYSIVKLKHNY